MHTIRNEASIKNYVQLHQPFKLQAALAPVLACLTFLFAAASRGASPPVILENIEAVPRLKITGTVGNLFQVEYVTDVSASRWTPLKNLILPSSPYYFLDTDAPGHAKRFYRVTSGPRPPAMVWVNPGTFVMGSPVEEDERTLDEGLQTTVTISKGFWMGQFEITQFEYLSLVGNNPSAFSDDLARPVETVTWDQALVYCGKLTEEERQAGRLPAGYAYRLPTEGEWEYAARGGTSTRFGYGDDPGYTLLDSYAWYGSNSGGVSHPVGGKLPNRLGLYDMHGNVWEWCSDWYDPFYLGGNVKDPQGPPLGVTKVIRSGSWKGLNRFCRSASRGSSIPFITGSNVGFRVVLAPASP